MATLILDAEQQKGCVPTVLFLPHKPITVGRFGFAVCCLRSVSLPRALSAHVSCDFTSKFIFVVSSWSVVFVSGNSEAWIKSTSSQDISVWLQSGSCMKVRFPDGSEGKASACKAGDLGSIPGFDPWVGKIPWRRKWQLTPVFLPGKFHGRRSLAGYSPWGRKESDMT